MEWGRDCGLGPRPARAFRRSHLFPHRRARPSAALKAASAQAIGLALHELATNAGKYGALSTDRGRVDIGWGIEGDTLVMSWTERAGPPVSAPKRRGFGTTVMEAMAERSVDGAVDLDYAPSGLVWRLTCRAANVLEPPASVSRDGFSSHSALHSSGLFHRGQMSSDLT